MQMIHYADAELKTRGINHRVGTFRYKEMGEGVEGSPGNFNLRLVWSQEDFFSPRHMHNFDQVRVQVQGTYHFDSDGDMEPGAIGFFPEGTLYGPQTSEDATVQLVLQIGGASGGGYISESQRTAAVDELAKVGRFAKGRYYPGLEGEVPGMDAFQAAWEKVQGKRLRYPDRRFEKPILTNPEATQWADLEGHAGVQQRRMWRFDPKTVGLDLYRLDAGATLSLEGPLSCFMQEGSGTVGDGSGSGSDSHSYAPSDAAHATRDEQLTITATQASRLIVFVHPQF